LKYKICDMKHLRFLLLGFFILLVFPLRSEKAKIFTPNEGLSNSHISQIYQDSYGYIWIATENGLNKFNGYDFTTYLEHPFDSTSLQGNFVYQVYEDSRGIFWVCTMNGLSQFDRKKDSFYPFRIKGTENFTLRVNWILEDRKGNMWVSYLDNGVVCLNAKTMQPVFYNKNNSGIGDNAINCAFEDRFGNLWFGTEDNGIYVYNPDNYTTKYYCHNPLDAKSLSSNKVFSICEDAHGNIVVGTLGGGINIFDSSSGSFHRVKTGDSSVANLVYSLCLDRSGNIWVGTDGAGIVRYDASGKKLPYLDEVSDICDLERAKIHNIFEDKQGNIWVALYQKGILLIPASGRNFQNYGFNSFDKSKSIGTHCVISIIEDSEGDVWIGTDGDGLYRINASDKSIEHITTSGIAGNVITGLFEDKDKNIWIGTYVDGFFRYNRKARRFDTHHRKTEDETGLSHNHVVTFVQDKDGILWIGTDGGGLNRFNIDTGQFKRYQFDDSRNKSESQLSSNWLYRLMIDSKETIWIGTSNGVNRFDPQTEQFTNYPLTGKSKGNYVYALYEDYRGNIWAGGFSGLHCIDKKTGEVARFTTLDGIPDDMITGIEGDKDNNLWISTGHGLCRFNLETKKCINFYADDGIQSNEFRKGSHFKGKNDKMYFGGINGMTTFSPADIFYKNSLLKLVFTDFLIYNESVKKGRSDIITTSLDETSSIRLKYNQRSFTFMFAALEYGMPQRVMYYTQMGNFDKRWRQVNSPGRSVTYTNLDPGTYTFKVRATLDGENFLEKEMDVIIQPPFYLTTWAKIIYVLLFVALIYGIWVYFSNVLKHKKELMDKDQQKQISESKLQFFTDISHEIRTPLTLIIAPLEKLINNSSDNLLQSTYGIMYQNAVRILRLINQLMDLRVVEKGKLKLRVEKIDVVDFIRKIMDSFTGLASSQQIDFKLITEDNLPEVLIDKDCLDKIVFNLLSNAFKFTPKGGAITVGIQTKNHEFLEISVEDTGVGIPKEQQEQIFERFYQVKDRKYSTKFGTGIGLHLSQMMVELHHGSIQLESEPDKGSKFTVQLPLNEEVYSAEEFGSISNNAPVTMFQPSVPILINEKTEKTKVKAKTNISLLVVEDDEDILNYIDSELSPYYRIYRANNGKEGLAQALKLLPDVVVSDIVMPEMDGLSLCKMLKSNEKTCHIPVILLTAKTSVEQRIEGLELGADSYIPKPFSIKHLQTRIEKLALLRDTLKQKYSGEMEIKDDDLKVVSSDEKLLAKFNDKLKEHINDPDLSVDSISKELGISRVHLNRKLKAITNESPGNYIRNYRLKHAAWLLTNKKMNIAEVAYAVGFSSHAYFSNIFKEHYGMSPTEYVETNVNQS